MKYLKKFNENIDQLENIKSKIEEITYILEDINLDVYVGAGAISVTITIDKKYDYPATSIDSAYTENSYANLRRKWQTSLAFDDSYLEFIDRVDEICKEIGYTIFVQGATYFLDKGIIRYYKFDKLIVATKNRGPNHIEAFIDVKKAIDIETKRGIPGIINKGLTWVGKKLNLI